MDGTNEPLWERPVRWPADGLPFDMRALRYVLAATEQMSFSGAAGALGLKVSTVSRYNHPDIILRPLTEEVENASTYLVASDLPNPPELDRFIERARKTAD